MPASPSRSRATASACRRSSVENMVAEVQAYVPGYRLKQAVQFASIGSNAPLHIPEMGGSFTGLQVSVFLAVAGAAHYLPAYASNIDIMTRSEERRVGKECVSTCKSRVWP